MSASQEFEIHRHGQIEQPKHPSWFGITVGSLVFAAYAAESAEAKEKVAASLGKTAEEMIQVPTTTVLYPETYQPELNERYLKTGRDFVRLIPFSVIEFPADSDEMSPEQIAALEAARRTAY